MGSQSEQATRRNGGGQGAGGCLGCTSVAAGEEPATAALARTEVSVRRTPRGVSRQKLDFIESKKIKQISRLCTELPETDKCPHFRAKVPSPAQGSYII